MGVVYRARDTRLNRDVAIKVLPDVFAADPARIARFEREAQTLAALNHPHIAQIHGVIGPAESAPHALVMELVDGEDLAQRLQRGAIPQDEALAIARQIAEALEAAHERGVIHRDLKPANVKITPDGAVKVLDFGLAKAMHADSGEVFSANLANSPTFTSPAMTGIGVILGTAAYMAPEQAKGKPVDRRADIWALGVILFEMLTGKLLYAGETVTETIAQVMTQPANLDALPSSTPPALRRILRRCLEKEPRNRFQSAGDVRIEIDEFLAAPAASAALGAPSSTPRPHWWWLWPAIAVASVALGLFIAKPWRSDAAAEPQLHVDVKIDDALRLMVDGNVDGALVAISPDGQTLVFLATRDTVRRLYMRRLNSMDTTPLSGTEGATSHFFSPDGRWVGFFAGGLLKKVALSGGAPVTIAPAGDARGGAWGPNDTIVLATSTTTGLSRVSALAGTPEPITTPGAGERTHRWPVFLPDGNTVVYMVQTNTGAYDDGNIEAVRLDTKERKVLVRGGTYPRYVAGYLTYVRENTLFAVALDEKRLETRGSAMPVLSRVLSSRGVGAGVGDGAAQVAFSNNGTAVFLSGVAEGTTSQLVIADRAGKQTVILPEKREYRSPRFSPDGTRIAIQIQDSSSNHLHVLDTARGTLSRVTFDGSVTGAPVWSPDGRRLAYFSDSNGGLNILTTRSDGGGESEAVTSSPWVTAPFSYSPDGKLIAAMEQGRVASNSMDLVVVSLADKKVTPFLSTPSGEIMPAFSPDGKWIAYQSADTGMPEIYVRPYPGPGGKWQISSQTGITPRWTKKGHEIVYMTEDTMGQFISVEITASNDTISAGKPQKLFEAPIAHPPNAWWYDVTADGNRFVFLKAEESRAAGGFSHVTLVTNFAETIRRATAR